MERTKKEKEQVIHFTENIYIYIYIYIYSVTLYFLPVNVTGVLKNKILAKIITTLFTVLVTAWVTGATSFSAIKATSL